ncbi:response regulator [Desulfovibrio sp. OttesenSCG-928-I05]|nr:response regulator [Desulfovibrio sp. OttesenSCG-928-I05]
MNIIAVDDEHYAILDLEQAIKEAAPDASLSCFMTPADALAYAQTTNVDIAFLDIDMGSMTGLSLALHLKEINPKTNIIFVTGYSEYMGSAFSMHASGYVLKPARTECIVRELENLRHPVPQNGKKGLRMQCFGNFEVFLDGKPLAFPRSKSKQLLAYLVDRKGAGVSAAEISSVLWGDKEYTRSIQKQVQTVISQMLKTLREAGIKDLVIKHWNSISVDTEKFSCDYYEFLQGDVNALNAYTGEYMENYSWAEMTAGLLTQSKLK